MRNLSCDEDGCKKLVYYIEDGYDGIEQAYCKKHGEEHLINEEYPSEIKHLKSTIRTIQKQVKCQNSKEGHIFPPPPKPKPQKIIDAQNPTDTQIEIATSGTFSLWSGDSHTCIKCGFTYNDPRGTISWRNNDITNIGLLDFKAIKATTKDSMGLITQ